MLIKKYFSVIFFIFFLSIFSYFNWNEYFEFISVKKNIENNNKNEIEKIEDFSVKKIKEINNASFYYTPSKELANTIIDKINNAKKQIYVEVYIFTHKSIRTSLIRAKERGVDIKVILEKNPYKAYNLNNKTYDILNENNIDVVWSDPRNYSLNHTKLLIIDELFIISTGNLSASNFTKNRDMFIFSTDKILHNNLVNIFNNDFNGVPIGEYNNNLVLSPNYSRKKIEKLFYGAKKSLKIHIPYIKDKNIVNILKKLKKDGIDINIVISEKSYNDDLENINELKKLGINIKYLDKYNMHSKAILVDDKYLFIGSINFSNYSLDNNREIGLLMTNYDIIKKYLNLFEKDLKNKSN